ncbi:tetrapyrrole biosynthesis uroporphyrinogen III synthase [Trametes polyzona]|nr:tetrapyrrole biosynthesis uroporphyrinogen III synthase [Trametes polyzona]
MAAGTSKRNVLLLRSPSESEDGGPDKYEEAFRARGYRPVSVAVLETVHKNLDRLADVVRRGGDCAPGPGESEGEGEGEGARYAGVIVTSGRACEAWRAVVQELEDALLLTSALRAATGWASVPFYVVGNGTASALSSIATAFPESPYVPRDIRGGAESGTAEKLARFIVSDLPNTGSRRLLYLTGDKNRDTLPKALGEAGIELESLQVYATQGSSKFEEDLKVALGEVPPGTESWWIVHFAPSAAATVAPTLERCFAIPAAHGSQSIPRRHARVAAIGPTTATFLRDELHLEVAVVSDKPTADALSEGVVEWDRNHDPDPSAGGA